VSEEQQTARIEPRLKWSRRQIGLLIVAVVFLAGTVLFQFAADKVKKSAEQSLLVQANEAVHGQIKVDSIDLSILGYVVAKKVQVLDTAGKPLAKIDRLQLRYNWTDLLKGQLGPQLIKDVTVDKPELWVAYHQTGLNWDGLLKTSN
jgi:hypothetical protein